MNYTLHGVKETPSGSSSISLHMACTVCGNNKTEGALGLHVVTLCHNQTYNL